MLFVLRLLCGSKRSYQGALDAIWENAKTLGASLPQATPVTPAAMCLARARVDPQMFRDLHQDILEQVLIERRTRWKERRVLAVDGAKVNLPRRLLKEGYALPNDKAYYPQGLVSCLYELMPRLPIDFDLYAHTNERQAALAHLKHLRAGDVVVYDRGYSSYDLLRAHVTRGLDAVFRLKKNANSPTINFLDRTEQEVIVAIKPDPKARESLQQRDPDMTPQPLTLRLVRYSVGDTEFALGTTLMPSDGLSIADLCDLYHHRWRLEELYKSQKFFMTLKAFNGKTEIGVRQELYANFAVITATRLMANDMDDELNERAQPDAATKRVNLKQVVHAVCRNIETLLMLCTNHLQRIVNDMVQSLASHAQKERPGRSFKRQSRKPISTFQKSK